MIEGISNVQFRPIDPDPTSPSDEKWYTTLWNWLKEAAYWTADKADKLIEFNFWLTDKVYGWAESALGNLGEFVGNFRPGLGKVITSMGPVVGSVHDANYGMWVFYDAMKATGNLREAMLVVDQETDLYNHEPVSGLPGSDEPDDKDSFSNNYWDTSVPSQEYSTTADAMGAQIEARGY